MYLPCLKNGTTGRYHNGNQRTAQNRDIPEFLGRMTAGKAARFHIGRQSVIDRTFQDFGRFEEAYHKK